MENKDYALSQQSESSSVLFHGNEVFVNKLLSRSSLSSDEQYSLPRKSETYNCKLPGTVPFHWEVKPGIPKDPPINEEDEDSSPITLESSLRLKKVSSLKSNNNHQNQVIVKKRTSLTGPNKTSWFFKRSKKTQKKSAMFPHSESSNSEDHGLFSSSSSLSSLSASKSSSSSTTAATESPSHKALTTSSLPISSRFRSLAKRLLRRLF